jgi:anaerobic magnesium-protoporphyrin IX monomethyl ester cyclase
MKVLFIRPPFAKVGEWDGRERQDTSDDGRFSVPPYSDLVVAAWLEKNGIDVSVVDAEQDGLDESGIVREIEAQRPDVIGVSAPLTCMVPQYGEIFRIAKRTNPNIVTIGGGIHFSIDADQTLQTMHNLDFIVRGEAEFTLIQLLESLRDGIGKPDFTAINGLSYRLDGGIVHNPPRREFIDMDLLPDPAWHLLTDIAYDVDALDRPWNVGCKQLPKLPMVFAITDRGCTGSCVYCTPRKSQGRHRSMSPQRSIELIENLYQRFGEKLPLWLDNLTFNADGRYVSAILDSFISHGLTGTKIINARTDCIVRDRRLLPKYKEAGIELIIMGAESTIESDLKTYKKGTTVDQTAEAIQLIQEHGMYTQCFFMVGEWEHNDEDIAAIVERSIELNPDIAVFEIVTPHPGTSYFNRMLKLGAIEVFDYGLYDHDHAVMRTQHLSRDEVKMMRNLCFMFFYANRKARPETEFIRRWNAIGSSTSDE